MLDHQAGDFVLLAEGAEPLGDVVADEALEDQDEVHAVVADAPLEGVEHRGLGVLVGLPVEPVELEEPLQGPPHVLADAAADHQDPPALGGREQVLVLVLEGVVVLGLFLADPVEVAADGAEAVAAGDEVAVGHHQFEQRGVGGPEAADDPLELGEELLDPFLGQVDRAISALSSSRAAWPDSRFCCCRSGLAGLLLAALLLPVLGAAGGLGGLEELLLGLGDVGGPVGVEVLPEGLDVARLVLLGEPLELVEDALRERLVLLGQSRRRWRPGSSRNRPIQILSWAYCSSLPSTPK